MSSRRVQRIALANCLLLLAVIPDCNRHHLASGFVVPSSSSPSSFATKNQPRRQHPPPLTVMSSSASSPSSYYPQFLESASKCTNSDTCSIDDAEMYLREIFHAQSGCAAGTVSGTEICEDVIVISEIVSNLRNKIRIGTGREEVG